MINSIYRFRSHAYHLGRRILHGYDREGFHHQPDLQLCGCSNDQYPADDMSREESKRYGYEVVKTPAEAWGLRASRRRCGALGRRARRLQDERVRSGALSSVRTVSRIVKVFEAAGRSVPVFVDKHLSYDAARGSGNVRHRQGLKFGLMAGSSLPVTWRRPELEPPLDTALKEGLVAFGFDRGPSEIYFFHAIESLQCMMERRRGGETSVQGDRVDGLGCVEGRRRRALVVGAS